MKRPHLMINQQLFVVKLVMVLPRAVTMVNVCFVAGHDGSFFMVVTRFVTGCSWLLQVVNG